MLKNHRMLSPSRLWTFEPIVSFLRVNQETYIDLSAGVGRYKILTPTQHDNEQMTDPSRFIYALPAVSLGTSTSNGLGWCWFSIPGICRQTYLARLGKSLLICHTCTKTWWNKHLHMPRYTIHMNHKNAQNAQHYRLEWPSNHNWKNDRHLSGSAPACLAWKGACQLMAGVKKCNLHNLWPLGGSQIQSYIFPKLQDVTSYQVAKCKN